jgi:uncharacterized protein (TIGR02996 family)
MNELAGLLEDIRQNPWDDTPRLVCADWYEDAGEIERATLIRLQCQQARLPTYERDPLTERTISSLVTRHGGKWLGPLRKIGKVYWERGFPARIECNASAFLKNADMIVHSIPKLTLRRFTRSIPALVQCSALRQVRSLTLSQARLSPQLLGMLLRSPHLNALDEFGILASGMNLEHFSELAQSSFIPGLQSLEILGYSVVCPDPQSLFHQQPASLQRLHLGHFNWTTESITSLANQPCMQQVRDLDLSYHGLTAEAGVALAQSPYFRNLRSLNLHFGNLNRGGAEALAVSPLLRHIERFGIGFNEITNAGIEALANSPYLGQLRQLNISHSEGTPVMGRHLARAPWLRQLRMLEVHYNALKDSGFKWLIQIDGVSQLMSLNLQSCELTYPSIQRLVDCPYLKNLRTLNLTGNSFGSKGATLLARSPLREQLWLLQGDTATFHRRGSARLQTEMGERYEMEP